MDDEPVVAADTPAELVAKIRRGAALQVAEKNLSELRRRAGEIQGQMLSLVAAKDKMLVPEHAADIDRELQRLADEHSALGPRIAPAFAAITAARSEYDERVTAALAPIRHEAQATAKRAAGELRAALQLFDACNVASRRVGAPEQRRPRGAVGYLDEIIFAFTRR